MARIVILTAIVKRSWIIQFTRTILERKVQFTWQLPSGTRSEAIDDEVSRLLYESGCRNMSYAPESGSPEVLKRIKKVVKLDKLEASVMGAVRNKLNIIMGFPNESRKELGQTVSFLARMGLAGVHDMSISPFSPYRILGFLVFYGTQYAVRPWRMATLLRNLLQHRQESRLDKSLQDLAHRMGNRRRSGPAVTAS